MHFFLKVLRKLLASRGFLLLRVFPEIPPTLEEYLRNLARRKFSPDALVCLDNEVQIQVEILSVFPAEIVRFAPSFAALSESIPDWPAVPSNESRCRRLVAIDAETFSLEQVGDQAPWVFCADIIIIRASLGFFWSGHGDLCRLARLARDHGFHLYDVLDYARLGLFGAPAGRVVFAFEHKDAPLQAGVDGRPRRHRISEALAYLSLPIAQADQLKLLAGRGSFGFPGGVFNPGAIAEGKGFLLLARGERVPWAVQRRNESVFLSACQPFLMTLDENHAVDRVAGLSWTNRTETDGTRMEDFRLVRYRQQLLTNHSVMTIPHRPAGRNRPLRLRSTRTRAGLSLVDVQEQKLRFLGSPELDCRLSTNEKNWVMFVQQSDLYLVYSFNPYHLLRAIHWPEMSFKTVIQRKLTLPFEGNDCLIRNSVNPVEYDRLHLLHIVHQVYRGQEYVFWAVLIDKSSLLPVMVSARPLVRGWHSARTSMIYVCSVVVREAEILLFAGINDSSTGFWRIPRTVLDQEWTPLVT